MRRELPLSVTVADDAPLCPCVRLCMREWSVCSRNHDTHTTIRYNGVFFPQMQPLNIAVTKSVLCAAGEQQQLGITAVVFYSLSFVPVAKVCE